MFFVYGEKETEYLKSRDTKLGEVIDRIGHIERETDGDLFSAAAHHIIGQQISNKALATVWGRMCCGLGEVTPETVAAADTAVLRSFGMSQRKAEYIREFAEKIVGGEFDLNETALMNDEEAIRRLTSLKGIGVWTAEMILLFCLQRSDIFSFGDAAIQRGVRMVYNCDKVERQFFKTLRERFSPYGSTASLYFWAVAGGALPYLRDPALTEKEA